MKYISSILALQILQWIQRSARGSCAPFAWQILGLCLTCKSTLKNPTPMKTRMFSTNSKVSAHAFSLSSVLHAKAHSFSQAYLGKPSGRSCVRLIGRKKTSAVGLMVEEWRASMRSAHPAVSLKLVIIHPFGSPKSLVNFSLPCRALFHEAQGIVLI